MQATFTVPCAGSSRAVSFNVDFTHPVDVSVPVSGAAATAAPAAAEAGPAQSQGAGSVVLGGSASGVGAAGSGAFSRTESGVQAFYLPSASVAPIQVGGWTGSIAQGASVNCASLCFSPHGSGTHTECRGHIMRDGPTIESMIPHPSLMPALLLTVAPVSLELAQREMGEGYAPGRCDPSVDRVVTAAGIREAVDAVAAALAAAFPSAAEGALSAVVATFSRAVLIRTMTPSTMSAASSTNKICFSGSNPPYLTVDAARLLAEDYETHHVVVDLPSVDREDDGGYLVAHRTLFRFNLPLTETVDGEAKASTKQATSSSPAASESSAAGAAAATASPEATAPSTAASPPPPPTNSALAAARQARGVALVHPQNETLPRTVTELAWFPPPPASPCPSTPASPSHSSSPISSPSLADGLYLLDLQVAPVLSDAAPSRPVLYPVDMVRVVDRSSGT